MASTQQEMIREIKDLQIKYTNTWNEYWQQYSDFNNWQFWVNMVFLLLPLIAIYIFLDKKRAFILGFFGFNIHVWFTYIDAFGVGRNFWFYPYKVLPILPTNIALDVSFVPAAFMFVYQWTLNRRKNYYVYSLAL